MINRICSDLERKAIMDGHVIGDGFEEFQFLGKDLLRMECARCRFYAVVNPEDGRHLKLREGRCDGQQS